MKSKDIYTKENMYSGYNPGYAVDPSSTIIIKRVVNGWILNTGMEGGDSTLVFNDFEELCNGLEVLYNEKESEVD